MADNQISVSVGADIGPLQTALQAAGAACETAATAISGTAGEIADGVKRAFGSLASAAEPASQALKSLNQVAAETGFQVVQQHEQTMSAMSALDQDYETRKRQLEIQALADQVAHDEAVIQQLQARLDRELAAHQAHVNNLRGLHQSAANDIGKIWDQAASQIEKSLMTSFNRMIVSGKNFQTTMRSIAQQVETALLTAVEKTVLSWLTGESTMTAGTVAGTTARRAAEESAGSAGLASMALKAIKFIFNDAAQTFAGIFAFLSPEMGPAAAGSAATGSATVMAAASSVLSAAGGAWSLPSDMLVLAHREESILPAHIAGPMRDFFTGRVEGGGGGDVHFHVHAMDSRDVASFFKRNGGALARALKGEQRNFNTTLASSFR
jgi:hypothetical protein